jgi:hypothetical protein
MRASTIRVPVNEDGLNMLMEDGYFPEPGKDCDDIQIFQLPNNYEMLPLYKALDDNLGTELLGDYTFGDIIMPNQLADAIKITRQFRKNADKDIKQQTKIILTAFSFALEIGMPADIDLI